MIERKLSGDKPAIRAPEGTTDTQIHLYLPEYPAVEGGPPLPGGTLPGPEQYRKVMDWLGIDRVVVTQGNAHQRDNSNLVACLERMGACARGVAVIDADTPDAEMERLHAAGVRGARIMDLPGGAVGLDGLADVDARAHAAGWVTAVQFDGGQLLNRLALLRGVKGRMIIDHHGKFFAGVTPESPEVEALKGLIDRGNVWFKFAACYESSRVGPPGYDDIAAVAREMAAFAPERIVWGTNWPHNQAQTTADYPDDGALFDTVLSWIEDDAARQQILVDNPRGLFGFPRT